MIKTEEHKNLKLKVFTVEKIIHLNEWKNWVAQEFSKENKEFK